MAGLGGDLVKHTKSRKRLSASLAFVRDIGKAEPGCCELQDSTSGLWSVPLSADERLVACLGVSGWFVILRPLAYSLSPLVLVVC